MLVENAIRPSKKKKVNNVNHPSEVLSSDLTLVSKLNNTFKLEINSSKHFEEFKSDES